ncbi:RNA polymerase sigma factor [Paractinoplanes atraurantiacus]|uniref:RNA polymerase sigma-70 factor, ECF subfamily n=1 Tax=Paractinoplanes atraurantiacus TaxID=1036182 RepID=A0A285IUR5_9ACTN|nr:sigma-70 family RNA polymerase sigma factor [Actinoplanes atraurantiacus]SNY51573.1 RNA polymerase sigma-70 factor, ECF subfamily [Actinoplanes atraurantiacus]
MSDESLVVRCQLGEREAFAELVRVWHGTVERYVRRMLSRADDDVVQEIWLAVVRQLPRLRQPGLFAPWLFAIARRAVMNQLRQSYASPDTGPLDESAAEAAGDPLPDLLDRELIDGALSALPPRDREVLILFYLSDLPLEACAQICAVPVGTVKSRLHRARRLLRAELLRKGYEA